VKTAKNKSNSLNTPSSIKVRLNVVNGSDSAVELLQKLLADESFVNPLCFDCEDDLAVMSKIIRWYSQSPPKLDDAKTFYALNQTLSQYLEDISCHLNESSESIDSMKAAYCMCIIGFLNIGALASEDGLKGYTSISSLLSFYELCKEYKSTYMILSAIIESYVAILQNFRLPDEEISQYSDCMFNFCFQSPGPNVKAISILAFAQTFSKYSDFRTYMIDQVLMRAIDSENTETQKLGVSIILTCFQALSCAEIGPLTLSLVTSLLNYCLNFCWKVDGSELLRIVSISGP
jgi:hypothetical protein